MFQHSYLKNLLSISIAIIMLASFATPADAAKRKRDPKRRAAAIKALDYLKREQRRQGYWEANNGTYRIPMTALSGMAMLCEGSTTTRGKYAEPIRRAVDYLIQSSQPSGLIGFKGEGHYTYGHGFSMLFLSQIYGEEEDKERKKKLKEVLTKAVEFSIYAQTNRGGWGYVSAKDGNQFDEGSTCVTQVQGLRACRNAGIKVPKEVIDRAKQYIYDCMNKSDGGLYYSFKSRGASRPPITAAAVAVMYSAGVYDQAAEVKKMKQYCEKNVWPGGNTGNGWSGHWHYMHYYYSQVCYHDAKVWDKYILQIGREIVRKQSHDGSWKEGGYIGQVYTTAICATILQLDNGYVPIYQR